MSVARKEGGAWTHSLIGSTSNRCLLMKLMSKLSGWSSFHLALSLAVGLFALTGVSVYAQNQTISGHLHVTGDTSLSGTLNVIGVAELNNNVTNFGANGANATTPGLVLAYTDTVSGTVSTITLATSGTTALWQWERNSANGLIPQMTLTGTNSIILWNPTVSNSVGIILNPAGDSTFSGSITATGTNSRLPNQQITTDTASVLTVGLGDGRYAPYGSYLTVNPTTLAVGYQSVATGSYATAFGNGSTASGYAQLVVGQYNQAQGNASSWSQNDNLFVIGNGTSDSNRSNAVVVKKSGDTSINGNLTVSKNTSVGGGFKALGASTFSGKIVALDTIRIAPKGDLQMGEFTSGEQTAAQLAVDNYVNLLATSSVTVSSAQKQNLANFLEAIDSTIGFDNVVECWSFREGQNIGSGNTAYGLLGRRNTTLVNAPTWTADGLKFNGVNQYGILSNGSLVFNNTEFGIFAVFQTEDNSYVQSIVGTGEINTANGVGIRVAGGVWADAVHPGFVQPAVRSYGVTDIWHMFVWDFDGSIAKSISNNTWYATSLYTKTDRIYFQVNGSANSDSNSNSWDTTNQYVDFSGGWVYLGADCWRPYYLKGKIAFIMVVKTSSVVPCENIYSIYKSTIGQGLGLP